MNAEAGAKRSPIPAEMVEAVALEQLRADLAKGALSELLAQHLGRCIRIRLLGVASGPFAPDAIEHLARTIRLDAVAPQWLRGTEPTPGARSFLIPATSIGVVELDTAPHAVLETASASASASASPSAAAHAAAALQPAFRTVLSELARRRMSLAVCCAGEWFSGRIHHAAADYVLLESEAHSSSPAATRVLRIDAIRLIELLDPSTG